MHGETRRTYLSQKVYPLAMYVAVLMIPLVIFIDITAVRFVATAVLAGAVLWPFYEHHVLFRRHSVTSGFKRYMEQKRRGSENSLHLLQ